ncbi:MAG: pilus assembly protein TadG, partial [Alphaproteobacteria bacterium]|nr:pilus assembly protein TadG [Alphaproteobacteria bacterium]
MLDQLWVALVLDNTGSMSETDNTGTSKIDALKTVSHQLLTMLQNASANPGDVKVSIVPFNRDVN